MSTRRLPEDSVWIKIGDLPYQFQDVFQDYNAQFANPGEHSRTIEEHFVRTVIGSVVFASWLAFTNWNTHIRSVSVGLVYGNAFMSTNFRGIYRAESLWNGILGSIDALRFAGVAGTAFSSGLEAMHGDSVLALQVDQTVVVRSFAACPSIIKNEGCLVCFHLGELRCQGLRRQRLIMSHTLSLYEYTISHGIPRVPSDVIQGLQSRFLCDVFGNTVLLQQELLRDDKNLGLVDAAGISRMLETLLITTPCGCNFDSPLKDDVLQKMQEKFNVNSGFTLDYAKLTKPYLFYQSVKGNELGQWCSIQLAEKYSATVCILQADACLNCTFMSIINLPEVIKSNSLQDNKICVCIIAGGENMFPRQRLEVSRGKNSNPKEQASDLNEPK